MKGSRSDDELLARLRAGGRFCLQVDRVDQRAVRVERVVERTVVWSVVPLLAHRVEGLGPEVDVRCVPDLALVHRDRDRLRASEHTHCREGSVDPVNAVPVFEVVTVAPDREDVVGADVHDVPGHGVGVAVDEEQERHRVRDGQVACEPERELAAALVTGDGETGDIAGGRVVARRIGVRACRRRRRSEDEHCCDRCRDNRPGALQGRRRPRATKAEVRGHGYLLFDCRTSVAAASNPALTAGLFAACDEWYKPGIPVEFRVLGPLAVVEDGRAIPLDRQRLRALLAFLLLHANEAISSDRLIDEVWGPEPPKTAGASLQNYISRLRKAIGLEALVSQPPGYVLRVDPERFDLARFERLTAEARHGSPAERAEKLRAALALWRGPALEDLAFEPFARDEVGRLEEARLAALESGSTRSSSSDGR